MWKKRGANIVFLCINHENEESDTQRKRLSVIPKG